MTTHKIVKKLFLLKAIFALLLPVTLFPVFALFPASSDAGEEKTPVTTIGTEGFFRLV